MFIPWISGELPRFVCALGSLALRLKKTARPENRARQYTDHKWNGQFQQTPFLELFHVTTLSACETSIHKNQPQAKPRYLNDINYLSCKTFHKNTSAAIHSFATMACHGLCQGRGLGQKLRQQHLR